MNIRWLCYPPLLVKLMLQDIAREEALVSLVTRQAPVPIFVLISRVNIAVNLGPGVNSTTTLRSKCMLPPSYAFYFGRNFPVSIVYLQSPSKFRKNRTRLLFLPCLTRAIRFTWVPLIFCLYLSDMSSDLLAQRAPPFGTFWYHPGLGKLAQFCKGFATPKDHQCPFYKRS